MKYTDEQQADIKKCMDILTNNPFFKNQIPEGKHWRVALFLNDVHFGCCTFTDEEAKNEFINHYQQLAKITGKKWGCALIECEKEKND